jgi:hypothetical protein
MRKAQTIPDLAQTAKTYSESGDQPICEMVVDCGTLLEVREEASVTAAAEGDGKEGTCHDLET